MRLGAIAPGLVVNELWGASEDDVSIEQEVAAGKGMRSQDAADAFMLVLQTPHDSRPRDVADKPSYLICAPVSGQIRSNHEDKNSDHKIT